MEKIRLYIEKITYEENNKKENYMRQGTIWKRYYIGGRLYKKEIKWKKIMKGSNIYKKEIYTKTGLYRKNTIYEYNYMEKKLHGKDIT